MAITLKNDFHGTEITLRMAELDFGETREISMSTFRRIHAELCGSAECACGIVRGHQDYTIGYNPNGGADRRGLYYIERTNNGCPYPR